MGLQFKLLQYRDLDPGLKSDLLEFTVANWPRWKKRTIEWCGGPDAVLPFSERRLADPGFPQEKKGLLVYCRSFTGLN